MGRGHRTSVPSPGVPFSLNLSVYQPGGSLNPVLLEASLFLTNDMVLYVENQDFIKKLLELINEFSKVVDIESVCKILLCFYTLMNYQRN